MGVMDRRTFVKTVGAGAAVALVPGIARGRPLYVPCPLDPPGDERSPDRLMETLGAHSTFVLGQELGRRDLAIHFPLARRVRYSLYYVDVSEVPHGVLGLIGPEERVPVLDEDDVYYASLLVPKDEVAVGSYLLRWHIDLPDFSDRPATRTVRTTLDTRFRVVPGLCRGDFTVVKTGEDERGAFVFSFRCDGCGSVSPPAFAGEHSQDCAAWRERHLGWDAPPKQKG